MTRQEAEGDTISRQAAIDTVCKFCHDWCDQGTCQKISGLQRLPSAQSERKPGKWIDGILPNDNGGLPVIVCDQCKTFFPLQFGASHNFCPNCGADMREKEEP